MKNKHIYILSFCLMLFALSVFAQQKAGINKIKALTETTNYTVGSNISLQFSRTENIQPLLYCSSSYGSTLISASVTKEALVYEIPKHITKKIGVVNWQLLDDENKLSGKLYIQPKANVATMETYLGPTSIDAGETDYAMLVTIPTDSLDNPVPTNTAVNINYQFLSSEITESVYTKNLIAYKNIYAPTESGRMLVASESLGVNSKEFTLNIASAIPTSFTISAQRPHDYADGNQMTTFTTSIIKDKHNNVASDGTFVTFIITNSKGNILKTTGLTLSGVANAKIIHPDYGDSWKVKAYVDGMAESNTINLTYQQVIKDFNVVFAKNNREITVGPLQSFMKQHIPDGLQVKLHIFKDGKHIKTLMKTTFNGYVNFNLKPAIYINGDYNFSIETAGITKEYKTKHLW